MNIQSTKDYSKFQKMTGNRQLDRKHFRKLREAVLRENQLSLHPIIVNKDMAIIDGQHRLEVAKDLGVDIYYIQSDSVSDMHLIEGNANQKSWDVENYIDFFAIKEQKPDYILLKNLMSESGLKPKAILTLVIGAISPILLDFLKTGKFAFPKFTNPKELIEFYLKFKVYVEDKRIKPIAMFTNFNFTRALRWIYLTSGFDTAVFFRKLDQKWFDLKPQRCAEDWYKLLITIYNFRNNDKISDEWTESKAV